VGHRLKTGFRPPTVRRCKYVTSMTRDRSADPDPERLIAVELGPDDPVGQVSLNLLPRDSYDRPQTVPDPLALADGIAPFNKWATNCAASSTALRARAQPSHCSARAAGSFTALSASVPSRTADSGVSGAVRRVFLPPAAGQQSIDPDHEFSDRLPPVDALALLSTLGILAELGLHTGAGRIIPMIR
jgi:hypothetical protein